MRSLPLWVALAGCGGEEPGVTPIRRLTPTEYNHTVRDLFGIEPDGWWLEEQGYAEEGTLAPWPWVFPADVPIGGFEGMPEGQVVSAYQVEQVQRAAEHFAPYVLRGSAFWACERPGRLSDADRRACARVSVLRLAMRAWRRPLDDDEQGRLTAAFDGWAGRLGTDAAVLLSTQALLQSPAFLYLPEDEKDGELPPFSVASRLSYALWDSMPDAELFAAADTGLRSRDAVRREARRMLEDPRARDMVARFHRQWLDLDRIHGVNPDPAVYADRYAPAAFDRMEDLQDREELWGGLWIGTRLALLEEVDLFVTTSIFDGPGTLSDLLTSRRGWVASLNEGYSLESSTASVYGASSPVEGPIRRLDLYDGNFGFQVELTPVEHPEGQRAGLLTLGATLAARAHPVHPAPVLRGVFTLQRLICQDLGAPPEGAALAAPPDVLDGESTNRQRLEALTSEGTCAACHRSINPLGFAFERYDALGGWRETDHGLPIDSSGDLHVPGEPTRAFSDAVELAGMLATSARVHDCYATQWARYLTADPRVAIDDPRFAAERERFRRDGDIRALLVDLVSSDAFRRRGAPADEVTP